MEIKHFIDSGIIEIYCLGLASEEETKLVEQFAAENKEVRDEIISISGVLNQYASKFAKTPSDFLKKKIMNSVREIKVPAFPPRISMETTVAEWENYMTDNNILPPEEFDMVHLLDLPGDDKQATYMAWAKTGAVVEETHDDEDEFLFMFKGRCAITVNGIRTIYNEGDVVFIPAKTIHKAEALSDDMLLIGQRVAA